MYIADEKRYDNMKYNRCGNTGLMLPAFSLGLWHNFGSRDNYDNMVDMLTTAFDLGITHFDLANNYGPYPGSAEENFGKVLKNELAPYRDELIISTKAGYTMWPGPYGDHGSRKYLIASLDQSLKRMGLDYVDIFYHHRPDPETPMEETARALDQIVRSGKAIYVGISNYNAEQTKQSEHRSLFISRDIICLNAGLKTDFRMFSMKRAWVQFHSVRLHRVCLQTNISMEFRKAQEQLNLCSLHLTESRMM